ncbi:uncharacterized protein EHS24_007400 [Apiotrichum porosum]|uniref:Glucose-methanol-choline oxidoreductase N-terminal domain-containing protein n=1 Tax=Apiotrichum porosum TaxID=105984 RepID=A0A427XUL2_9TREE|nr:uncharacterized protein EHS24_007400 [Apiotrichum porosum]RSH82431.1 hypothetical protein EHS24_007400 [Apiotrichum porosum]
MRSTFTLALAAAAVMGPAVASGSTSSSRSRERRSEPYHHSKGRDGAFNPNHPELQAIRRGAITASVADVANQSFDFVIAGGGLAGLVAGARLSEWSNVTVLVIEAGGDGSDVETQQTIPGYTYLHGISSNSPYGWNYTTTNLTGCNMLTKNIPLGRGLGGSGAVNGMFWCRGDSVEYDAWGSLNPNGNQTWDWAEVNKYIMKAENLTVPSQSNIDTFTIPIDTSAHGSGGPLQIGWSSFIYPVVANWVPTWVNMGFAALDLAAGSTHGVTITPSTLNAPIGSRSDSKTAYIEPNSARPNLVVLTGQQVTKVLFNGTKDASGNIIASGVQFAASASDTTYTVNANKEVILTAGTIGTSKLLQLSGIGPTSVLTGVGIDTVLDLPVGYNYQDHVSYTMYFDTVDGIDSWYNLATNDTLQAEALAEWEASKTGVWTYINEAVGYLSGSDILGGSAGATSFVSGLDTTAMVTTLASKYTLPSTVQAGLKKQLDLQTAWLSQSLGQFEIILHLWGKSATSLGVQVALQHPFSRGQTYINSNDPFVMPILDPGYFDIDADVQMMQDATAWVRTMTNTAPMNTIMTNESLPGASVTGDALTTYFKTACGTEYHPIGTASMLPQELGGVVDTNLVVYGTSNLRVLDSSIIPIHVSAHTMASTYGVAEKGCDIIKSQHWYVAPVVSSTSTSASATSSATSSANTESATAEAAAVASTGLSTAAKIGVGVGCGLGAIGVLAAIFLFCLRRKKSKPDTVTKGAYMQGNTSDQWMDGYNTPNAFAMAGQNRPSLDTMATADLHHPNPQAAGYYNPHSPAPQQYTPPSQRPSHLALEQYYDRQ